MDNLPPLPSGILAASVEDKPAASVRRTEPTALQTSPSIFGPSEQRRRSGLGNGNTSLAYTPQEMPVEKQTIISSKPVPR
jgi:hypothetical protein